MQCTLEQQERVNQMKAKAQANMKQLLDFVLNDPKVSFFIVTDDNIRVSIENVSIKQNGLGAIIFTDTCNAELKLHRVDLDEEELDPDTRSLSLIDSHTKKPIGSLLKHGGNAF
ncbi:conserved hypothetical protein [Candidatus Desulfosporosinus infrequens]|uniref:Uncharacterized protein n=1 Tax=Candidatus Desulfosporosinus infrequens TaxID=2043169 RepID=A0A2U3LCE0_9FIRM|nr:conserved hypothetical protein [Candidatus Desulfosporosinus infrequens]